MRRRHWAKWSWSVRWARIFRGRPLAGFIASAVDRRGESGKEKQPARQNSRFQLSLTLTYRPAPMNRMWL